MGSTDPNPNPVATIVSNLTFDVDIYDVFNPNSGPTGPLTYTKLGTVPGGAKGQNIQTIRLASQLQAMRSGNITALNNIYYQQFPVAVMAVDPFADSNSFTLTPDMQQGMEQSFNFIKYTQANPSSSLAKDFATGLGTSTPVASGSTTTAQDDAVNKFFQGTGSFQLCTMTSWNAVFNWQAQFTNAWQGTYYLYTLGNSSTPPALLATLVITSTAQTDSAVLTMAGSNNQNVTVVMTGDGTMQDANPGGDNLSATLTPGWMNVSQTSQQNGQPVTTNVLGVVFTGTINGQQVAGNINQLSLSSSSGSSSGSSSSSSQTQMAIASFSLNTIFQVAGLLTSIGMLYYMAKEKKNTETQKVNDVSAKAKTKTESDQGKQKVRENYNADDVPDVHESALGVEPTRSVATEAYKPVAQAQSLQAKNDLVQREIKDMRTLIQDQPPNRPTEEATSGILKAQKELKTAADSSSSSSSRDAAIKDVGTTLDTVSTTIKEQLSSSSTKVTAEVRQKLTETTERIDAEKAQAKSVEDAQARQQEESQQPSSDETDASNFDAEEPDSVEFHGE